MGADQPPGIRGGLSYITKKYRRKTDLVVLHCYILTLFCFVRNLHEEPADESLPDSNVQPPLVMCGHQWDLVAFHGAL